MSLGSITKLVTVILVVATVAILGYFSKIQEQAVTALLGALIGYVLGNGQSVIQSNKVMSEEINKILSNKNKL